MENEDLSESRSGVKISITNASASEDEFDGEHVRHRKGKGDSNDSFDEEEMDKLLDDGGENGQQNGIESNKETSGSKTEEEMSESLRNGVSLTDEKASGETGEVTESEDEVDPANGVTGEEHDQESKGNDSVEGFSPGKTPPIEMIGDRVLIERDGKFELVDVSEIKAEYFEMLGISVDQKSEKSDNESVAASNVSDKESIEEDEKPPIQTQSRPKTTTLGDLRLRTRKSASPERERRTMSAKSTRSMHNEDYAYLKSKYGMTEEQLKIKKKREEAIAKRKKEEREREEEEMKRKREDAERAFQAWLMAKIEEAKERRREEAWNKHDPSIADEKSKSAQQAYEQWLETKKKQGKVARDYERSRKSEEASQFIIRDRQLCDEAFKRWTKKKNAAKREKASLKKKRKQSKPKLKKKEPLPINSKNITYYEYYGYRNHVVL